MYVICVYDVNEKTCVKVMKILRRYLFHIQKSVFEGTLTPKQFSTLKEELHKVTSDEDSVLFYLFFTNQS